MNAQSLSSKVNEKFTGNPNVSRSDYENAVHQVAKENQVTNQSTIQECIDMFDKWSSNRSTQEGNPSTTRVDNDIGG